MVQDVTKFAEGSMTEKMLADKYQLDSSSAKTTADTNTTSS